MKYLILLFGMLLSAHTLAESSATIAPLNQKLTEVEYSDNGRQSGCGLRATGETRDNVALNVLITVFMKDTGSEFGVIKVVARKMNVQDGKITYTSIGNIRKAWVQAESGKKPLIYKNGESSHADAYMVTSEFSSTVNLLAAILQENFKVGINRHKDGPDEIFQFDKPLAPDEGYKLSVCMKNLRAAMKENKLKESF